MPGFDNNSLAIRARGLRRRFGRDFWAVDDIDLDVHEGEIVGLLGPNGAGKSTTMRMLCGLLLPTEGEIRVADIDPVQNPLDVKAHIGYVTQHFSLYADLTVRENLRFYGQVYGVRASRLDEVLDYWVEVMELDQWRDRPMSDMPPGWTRRAMFACAMLHDPPVLILDEPTSGVDLETSDLLWRLAREKADDGAAILVSTHFMAEAERCDTVNIMAAGHLVGEGTPQELVSTLQDRMMAVEARPLNVALKALSQWDRSLAATVSGSNIRVEIAGDVQGALQEARQIVEDAGGTAENARRVPATLDDVFLHLVTEDEAVSVRREGGQ
ncbi:MAG: ABC transporter ATP-binding protein [Armatimonadota bacterium]